MTGAALYSRKPPRIPSDSAFTDTAAAAAAYAASTNLRDAASAASNVPPAPGTSSLLLAERTVARYGAIQSNSENANQANVDKRVSKAHHRHRRPESISIAASTSFFGLPRNLSSASLRSTLGLHPPPLGEVDWVSIYVVYWITLVSEASRGLMLPSTWPYLQSLGGTKGMLGVFVASFSVGRMLTTIPLGYLSDKFSTASVLMVASAIQVAGHMVYAVAPSVWVLLVSRTVVGFGSATMSVCRAHLTRAVPQSKLTHHFAYLSALQFIGFAVLPGVGGLLAMLPELNPFPFLHFNGYTYPGWVLVIANMVAMLAIYSFYFDPPPRGNSSQRAENGSRGDTSDSAENSNGERSYYGPDVLALVVCLLINITFRGIVAELETVATPFLMEQFSMSYSLASYYISIIGFLGLGVYLGFKPIAKRFSDRSLVVYGLSVVVLGSLPLALRIFTSRMSLNVYVACIGVMWSLAYPVGQTAVLALFSKVLADLPAGGFLGIFSASGSLARIVFAMLAGKMWSEFGREAVFATILGYIGLALALSVFTYKRLVPPPDV